MSGQRGGKAGGERRRGGHKGSQHRRDAGQDTSPEVEVGTPQDTLPSTRAQRPLPLKPPETASVQVKTVDPLPSQHFYVDSTVLGLSSTEKLPSLLRRNDLRIGLMMREVIQSLTLPSSPKMSYIMRAILALLGGPQVADDRFLVGFLDRIMIDRRFASMLSTEQIIVDGVTHELLSYIEVGAPKLFGCMLYAIAVSELPVPKAASGGGEGLPFGTDVFGQAKDSYLQLLDQDPFDERAVLQSIFSPTLAFSPGTSRDVLRQILSTAANSDDTVVSPFKGAARAIIEAFNEAEEENPSPQYGYFSDVGAYYSCLVATSEAARMLPTLRYARLAMGSAASHDAVGLLTDLSGYSVLAVVRAPLQNLTTALSLISLHIVDTLSAITFANREPTVSITELLSAERLRSTADSRQQLVALAPFFRLVLKVAHDRRHKKIQQEDVVSALERWISYHVNDQSYESGVGTLDTLSSLTHETVKVAFSIASATSSLSKIRSTFRTLSYGRPPKPSRDERGREKEKESSGHSSESSEEGEEY